jgi:hypothetical protein
MIEPTPPEPLELTREEFRRVRAELDRLRTVNAVLASACKATVEEIDHNGRLSRAGLDRLRAVLAQVAGGGA